MSQVSNTSFTTTVSSNAMAVVDYLSKSMMSALPFIVCAALFRTVAVIMGEGMLGLWSADSDIYRLFYSWLYNAGYYFFAHLSWLGGRPPARLLGAAGHDAGRRIDCARSA